VGEKFLHYCTTKVIKVKKERTWEGTVKRLQKVIKANNKELKDEMAANYQALDAKIDKLMEHVGIKS